MFVWVRRQDKNQGAEKESRMRHKVKISNYNAQVVTCKVTTHEEGWEFSKWLELNTFGTKSCQTSYAVY